MNKLTFTRTASAVSITAAILLAAGCGGGSSSDESEESTVVSRGQITGFGSIYVNNRRFRTERSSFSIDDDVGIESQLRVGMIVTVLGRRDGNGDWHADRVLYDNELKGPVSSLADDPADPSRKIAVVLGQDVIINAGTRFDDDGGLDFDTIKVGDVIEVSGFIAPAGLIATHIELQDDDDEIEIKGVIEDLDADSFTIRGFDVSYNGSTEIDDDIAMLENGLFVEVEGQLDLAGTTLIAKEIESEDDHFGKDDDFEIEGVIMDFDDLDKTFSIQGVPVDASSATRFPASLVLAEGLSVEVEGHFVGGVLFADKLKQRGNRIEIDAPLFSVGVDSVKFRFNGTDVEVQVNAGTELEDDTGNPVSSLADFSAGNFVELEAFEDGAGILRATEIERTDVDKIEIEAPVDSFDEGLGTVNMLGVGFDLSAAKFEGVNDQSLTATAFFGALSPGRFIELEDEDSNGVIDKAELED